MDKQLPTYPFVCSAVDYYSNFAKQTDVGNLLNTFEMLFTDPFFSEMFTEIQRNVGCRNGRCKYCKYRKQGYISS